MYKKNLYISVNQDDCLLLDWLSMDNHQPRSFWKGPSWLDKTGSNPQRLPAPQLVGLQTAARNRWQTGCRTQVWWQSTCRCHQSGDWWLRSAVQWSWTLSHTSADVPISTPMQCKTPWGARRVLILHHTVTSYYIIIHLVQHHITSFCDVIVLS